MSQNTGKPYFKPLKLGINSILLLTAACVFFYLSQKAKLSRELLLSEGTVIEGTVTDKRLSTSDDYGDKYYITYLYSYNYEEYTDENRVYNELWERTAINDTIHVRIQHDKPGNSQINSSLIFPESEDYGVIAFALLFTGLMFIFIPYYKPLKKYLKEKRNSMN